jgi:hypothetical protein
VHDLEPGFVHEVVGVKAGVGREVGFGDHPRAGGVGVAAAGGVGLELDLANAAVKLLAEGLMLVVEALVRRGVILLPDRGFAGAMPA